jgi:hypothetical protein
MNEQDVRALVREAIERHLGRPEKGIRPLFLQETRDSGDKTGLTAFSLLTVEPGSQVDDGMCVIEPAVRCNHCGFCQSYGH